MPEPLVIMALIASPSDFPSWPRERQRERYRRVLDWHDFVRSHNPDRIPWIWGTHQVLSHDKLSPLSSMHIVVYRVENLSEFDHLMANDPLRECSRYTTWVLASLMEDHEKDLQRFNRFKKELFGDQDPMSIPEFRALKALYRGPPDYVGQYKPQEPPNVPIDLSKSPEEEEKLQILVAETNTDGNQDFEDARQLIIYEKILWWAEYASMLISRGQLSHGWTWHNFCEADQFSVISEAAVAIYTVDSWDEWDKLYSLNPLRRSATKFWSIVLQPALKQFEMDRARYEIAARE